MENVFWSIRDVDVIIHADVVPAKIHSVHSVEIIKEDVTKIKDVATLVVIVAILVDVEIIIAVVETMAVDVALNHALQDLVHQDHAHQNVQHVKIAAAPSIVSV